MIEQCEFVTRNGSDGYLRCGKVPGHDGEHATVYAEMNGRPDGKLEWMTPEEWRRRYAGRACYMQPAPAGKRVGDGLDHVNDTVELISAVTPCEGCANLGAELNQLRSVLGLNDPDPLVLRRIEVLTTPELAKAARDLANDLATIWSCGTIAFAQGPPQPDLARRLLEEWHRDAKSCGVRKEIMRRYESAFAMGEYVAAFAPPHPTSPGWATSLSTHMYHAVEGPLIDRLKEIAGGSK